jgi:hypothetical protein
MASMSGFDGGGTPDGVIGDVLEAGERLLWSGGPQSGLMLRAGDIFLIPFSLIWGGFAIFWESMVIRQGASLEFPIFGSFFVVAGLYLIFGRFLTDAFQRRRTAYAVTDRRIVIVTQAWQRRIRSLILANLGEIELAKGRGGRGTITFGRDASSAARGYSPRGWPGSGALAPAFEGIEGAADVMGIIRDAQRASDKR